MRLLVPGARWSRLHRFLVYCDHDSKSPSLAWTALADHASFGRSRPALRPTGARNVQPRALVSLRMQSELPPGWQQSTDPASGREFYYNAETGVTSWDPPAAEPEMSNREKQMAAVMERQRSRIYQCYALCMIFLSLQGAHAWKSACASRPLGIFSQRFANYGLRVSFPSQRGAARLGACNAGRLEPAQRAACCLQGRVKPTQGGTGDGWRDARTPRISVELC